jgi:hypothetical protein
MSGRSEVPKPPSGELPPIAKAPATKAQQDDPPNGSTSSQPQLNDQLLKLRDRIRQVRDMYSARPVNARDHSPWEVFHWILAYNVEAEIHLRGPGGETTNAVAWLCYNYPCRGQQLLTLEHGRPMGVYGVGLEGHNGQFMAILGQSRVMIDYPLRVKGRQFTVADLVENCKLSCSSGKDVELTFLLIGLAHYLHPNEVWKNRQGDTWSIARLVREEMSKPIHGVACGGTHRLMGLAYAVRKRQQHDLPIQGEFRRAQIYVNDYINYALRLQNPDGSLSTEWFTGRGAREDKDRRLQTTGHILEWLVFSVPDERLVDPQIVKTVDYVARHLLENQDHEWKIGHLGHALRSLSLYDRRLFKPQEADVPVVAKDNESPGAEPAREAEQMPDAAEKNVTKPAVQDHKPLGVEGPSQRTSERPKKPDRPALQLYDL